MQFGEVAADMVLFRFGEKNIQISPVIFQDGSTLKFEVTFQSQILRISIFKNINFIFVRMQQLMTNNIQFTDLF